jgi:hypothetical protein
LVSANGPSVTGRRRRTYRITDAGTAALRAWIRDHRGAQTELRDTGLLKLFFAGVGTQGDVVALARAQMADHERRLAAYELILAQIEAAPHQAFARATLQLGLAHERGSVDFWRGVAENPPTIKSPLPSRVAPPAPT